MVLRIVLFPAIARSCLHTTLNVLQQLGRVLLLFTSLPSAYYNDDERTCHGNLEIASQAMWIVQDNDEDVKGRKLHRYPVHFNDFAGRTNGGVLMAVYRGMASEGREDVDWLVKNGGHVDGSCLDFGPPRLQETSTPTK